MNVSAAGTLLALLDFSRAVRRNKTTIMTWMQRGQHDIPVPIDRTSAGYIWLAEAVTAWAEAHPELLGPEQPGRPADPFARPPGRPSQNAT